MPKPSVSKAGAFVLLAACAAGAGAKELRFEDAFAAPRPASLHYEARFVAQGGGEHKLEAWREGETRIKRRTDDAVETYAVRRAGDAEYAMTVLDLRRNLATKIARTNLFRI